MSSLSIALPHSSRRRESGERDPVDEIGGASREEKVEKEYGGQCSKAHAHTKTKEHGAIAGITVKNAVYGPGRPASRTERGSDERVDRPLEVLARGMGNRSRSITIRKSIRKDLHSKQHVKRIREKKKTGENVNNNSMNLSINR